MDIGTCYLGSCKKTIKGYLESAGLIEKPPSFTSQVKHSIKNALVQIGLLNPEPAKWISDDHIKSQLLVLAVVVIIFTVSIIAKLIILRRSKVIISKRSSRPRSRMQKRVVYGYSQVEEFLRDLSDRNCLPGDLDSKGIRGFLRLFEKYIKKMNSQRRRAN